MLVKTVATIITEDSAGTTVDAVPVREVTGYEDDITDKPVDIVSITEDPNGVPVRIVLTKYATDSAGHQVDVLPVEFTA